MDFSLSWRTSLSVGWRYSAKNSEKTPHSSRYRRVFIIARIRTGVDGMLWYTPYHWNGSVSLTKLISLVATEVVILITEMEMSFDEIFKTDCTGSCHVSNFRWSQCSSSSSSSSSYSGISSIDINSSSYWPLGPRQICITWYTPDTT